MKIKSLFLAFAFAFTTAQAAQIPVDFSPLFNTDLSTLHGFPTGSVVLGGVTFQLPGGATTLDSWHSEYAAGINPRTLSIPTSINSATQVFLLINSYWGLTGAPAYASLTFSGTGGAYHFQQLFGGTDVRDYNQGTFTNTINGVTTVNVYQNGNTRLDMVIVTLPASFLAQTLTTITLTDNGATNQQRTFLYGVTADGTTPEPGTLVLVGAGMLAAFAISRRRR